MKKVHWTTPTFCFRHLSTTRRDHIILLSVILNPRSFICDLLIYIAQTVRTACMQHHFNARLTTVCPCVIPKILTFLLKNIQSELRAWLILGATSLKFKWFLVCSTTALDTAYNFYMFSAVLKGACNKKTTLKKKPLPLAF